MFNFTSLVTKMESPTYSLFTLRIPYCPLRINGEGGSLRASRLVCGHPFEADNLIKVDVDKSPIC